MYVTAYCPDTYYYAQLWQQNETPLRNVLVGRRCPPAPPHLLARLVRSQSTRPGSVHYPFRFFGGILPPLVDFELEVVSSVGRGTRNEVLEKLACTFKICEKRQSGGQQSVEWESKMHLLCIVVRLNILIRIFGGCGVSQFSLL